MLNAHPFFAGALLVVPRGRRGCDSGISGYGHPPVRLGRAHLSLIAVLMPPASVGHHRGGAIVLPWMRARCLALAGWLLGLPASVITLIAAHLIPGGLAVLHAIIITICRQRRLAASTTGPPPRGLHHGAGSGAWPSRGSTPPYRHQVRDGDLEWGGEDSTKIICRRRNSPATA